MSETDVELDQDWAAKLPPVAGMMPPSEREEQLLAEVTESWRAVGEKHRESAAHALVAAADVDVPADEIVMTRFFHVGRIDPALMRSAPLRFGPLRSTRMRFALLQTFQALTPRPSIFRWSGSAIAAS